MKPGLRRINNEIDKYLMTHELYDSHELYIHDYMLNNEPIKYELLIRLRKK